LALRCAPAIKKLLEVGVLTPSQLYLGVPSKWMARLVAQLAGGVCYTTTERPEAVVYETVANFWSELHYRAVTVGSIHDRLERSHDEL